MRRPAWRPDRVAGPDGSRLRVMLGRTELANRHDQTARLHHALWRPWWQLGRSQRAQQEPKVHTDSRNVMEFFSRSCPGYSGLMPANLITLAHFSVSSAINFPKSAGEPGSTAAPCSANRALIVGSARPALISLLSLSTLSVGVFLGAPTPNHTDASGRGTKSLIVGISGHRSERVDVVTAKGRSLPARMCAIDETTESNMTCTWPASRSVIAGAWPR